MKTILVALACCTAALAADLKLADGRIFRGYRVLSQTPTTVLVRHAGGAAKIDKHLLPPDVLAKYPIDERGAAAEAQQTAKAKAAYEQQVRAAAEKEALERKNKADQAQATKRELEQARQQGRRDAELAAAAAAASADVSAAEARRKQADREIAEHNMLAAGIVPPELGKKIKAAVLEYADMYFKTEYKQPSSELPLDIKVRVDEPRALSATRFEVAGLGWWSSYVSQGRSFTANKTWFEAAVEMTERGTLRVTSFSLRSSEPLRR